MGRGRKKSCVAEAVRLFRGCMCEMLRSNWEDGKRTEEFSTGEGAFEKHYFELFEF